MAVFNEPNQWKHPLGNNADISTLPDDAVATAGIASLQKLFQIINATPLEAGGIAPGREDVNALFKYLGDQIFYTQNGGVPSYNAAYDYIPGRVVLYDNNLYKCIQANGVSSKVVTPDSDTAYWQRLDNFVRSVNGVNADTSGNVTISFIPDYTTGVTKPVNVENTAEYDGWLLATNKADDCRLDVTVNNVFTYSSYSMSGVSDFHFLNIFIPLAKGDIYKVTGDGSADGMGGKYLLSCMFFKMR